MPTVIIDGRELELGPDERLNGIQAASRLGIEIPHYCWHPALSVVASCRMCLVEVGSRDAKTGKIAMLPRLAPACATPAKDGTVFVTTSEKVQRARAMVEEDLLLRHPIDCPICDKAGECQLQDYHFKYGQRERRADIQPFTSRRRDLGDNITLFVDRCVMCSRCVRFTREMSGSNELLVARRGSHEEIEVVPGFPLDNNLSGNVVDLCPVGALCDKDFLYRQRVWFLRRREGVCTLCSTGCSIWVEENQDRVYRIKPRENPQVNGWWICNRGRYGYPHVHSDRRLDQPLHREAGTTAAMDWRGLPQQLAARLKAAAPLAGVLSPHLTVEEAYLLACVLRAADPQARLFLGPVPRVGDDEHFPNGFVVHAEQCPNRRGIERLLERLSPPPATWDDLLGQLAGGNFGGIWVAAGYREPWIDEATAARFNAPLLVVQDLFESPLSARATFSLPAAAYVEREGSYVNFNERLQSVRRAIRPPAGVRTEGSLFWEMLGRQGLYRAEDVLQEIATGLASFSAAAGGVPPSGVDLRINQLADPSAPQNTA